MIYERQVMLQMEVGSAPLPSRNDLRPAMPACLGTGTLEKAFVVGVVAFRLHPLAIYVGIRICVPASGLAVRGAISVSGGIAGLADSAVTGGSRIDIALGTGRANK